jgi:hypothetical protein
MDTKEKDYDADAVLAELRESLKKINEPTASVTLASPTEDTITFSNITGYDYGISAQDTITLNSSYNNTVINGGYSFGGFTATGLGGAGTSGGPYTINSGAGTTTTPWATSNQGSTKIHLEGEDADIEINGKSLAQTIQSLEERLNVLVPNPKLEKEWNELKELGDKYRKLETELKEKGEMWAKLKSMPPPEPLY